MAHFDEMTGMQYLDGQLDRARAADVAAHLEECAECRRVLEALEHESEWIRSALVEEEEGVPARLLSLPGRERLFWAWIGALGFACAGAYYAWTGLVEPWQERLSQAGFGESNLMAILFFGGVFWKGWGDMLNLVNLLATVTLVGLGFVLLRRNFRRWTTVALVMGSVLGTLALPPAAEAAEYRKKQSFTLAEGEVFKNDLILLGATARIDGTIEGDLFVFGSTVTINGRVTGDVIAFAESLNINGTVDGDIRAFASKAEISGTVAKNVTLFTQMLEFGSKGQVNGGMLLLAANATLDGRVARDLLALSGRTYLNGTVGGNIEMRGESLMIGSTAQVLGKTKFVGRKQPEVETGAKLASPVEFEKVTHRPDYASPRFYWKQALRWGAAVMFGLVVLLLAPAFFREAGRAGDRIGPVALAGLGTFFLVPIVAIIACITLVGLAVGLSMIALWLIAIYAAQVFAGTWLGNKLLGEADGVGALLGRMALGLLLLRVAVNIPYAGGWIWFVVFLFGMGAAALTIYDRLRTQPVVV